MKLIGDDLQEAIDWLQDKMSTTRPLAEKSMIDLLKTKVAVTLNEGIFLTEEEEEVEEKVKRFSQRINYRKRSNAVTGKRSSDIVQNVMKKLNTGEELKPEDLDVAPPK